MNTIFEDEEEQVCKSLSQLSTHQDEPGSKRSSEETNFDGSASKKSKMSNGLAHCSKDSEKA
jgi:hypothetical protein